MTVPGAAVLLLNPKTPYNVGAVLRACSIFGAERLRYSGDRIERAESRRKAGSLQHKDRLPREERMKDYSAVDWGPIHHVRAVTWMVEKGGYTPVAVEVSDNAEQLPTFVHPYRALYVFGPEDGSIERGTLTACHRFLTIPSATRTPLNLAAAVNLVLYDRFIKGPAGAENCQRCGMIWHNCLCSHAS